MTAARVLDCLAGQWIEWRDVMASNGLPDEVIESFVRPVFYSGALSVMALLAEGVDAMKIKEELERYAMENPGFEPEYHA